MKRSSSLFLLLLFSWTLCGANFSFVERFDPRAIYNRLCERWFGPGIEQDVQRLDQTLLLQLGGYTDTLIKWDITGFYEGERLLFKPDAPLNDLPNLLGIEAVYNKTARILSLPDGALEISVTPGGIYAWQMGFPIQQNPAVIALVERIRQKGLLSQFFFENPNLSPDIMVQLTSPQLAKRDVRRISMERAIADRQHDIFMISEIPGTRRGAKAVETLVKGRQIDWVALEAFTMSMQNLFDAYVFSTPQSDDGQHALEAIKKYINDWKDVFPELASEGENHYLEILKICRDNGVRVMGIEPTPDHSPYKLKTRNRLWALDTPTNGVGIVYGLRKHFEDNIGANYQDYVSKEHEPVFVRF